MNLAAAIIKKINGPFEPLASISLKYRNQDMVVRTDKEGNAVQLFIGKANEEGLIRGDRYCRVLVKDKDGKIIKDHWDRKGRAS